MRWSMALCVWILVAALGSADAQEELFRLEFLKQSAAEAVPRSVPDEFYLSPELKVVESLKASIAGVSSDGDAIFALNDEQRSRARGMQEVSELEAANVARSELEPAELIVGFARDADPEAVEQSLLKSGYQIVPRANGDKFSKRGRFFVVKTKGERETKAISGEMVRALRSDVRPAGATSATLNYQIGIPKPDPREGPRGIRPQTSSAAATEQCEQIPNDPRFDELWGMANIHAPAGWTGGTASPVVVAVIDSGVDHQHPDLVQNMWTNAAEASGTAGVDDDGNGYVDDIHGYDFANNDGDPMDDNAHGTHVAGTIGAVADNVGVVGVCWDVEIMAIKFLSAGGSGSLADAIDAIYYGIDNGAKIENNSWGGGGYNPQMEAAIEEANSQGVLFVAAAGNTANNDNDQIPHYPSSYEVDNVIAVASINVSDELSWFSCFGANSVDLAAPGGTLEGNLADDILSTIPKNLDTNDGTQDGYAAFAGTSMATPHVSGALALMKGHANYESMDYLQQKDALLNAVRSLPPLSGKCVTAGTLDISFLKDCGPGESGKIQIVSVPIDPGTVQLGNDESKIASLTLTLGEAAVVAVTGNTSVRSLGVTASADAQLFCQDGDWQAAVRFLDFPADQWTGLSIHHVTSLPAGTHSIEWTCWVNRDFVNVDGGTLSVIAVAASSADSVAAMTAPSISTSAVSQTPNRAATRPQRITAGRATSQPRRDFVDQRGGGANQGSRVSPVRVRSVSSDPATSNSMRSLPRSTSGSSSARVVDAFLEVVANPNEAMEVRLRTIDAVLDLVSPSRSEMLSR